MRNCHKSTAESLEKGEDKITEGLSVHTDGQQQEHHPGASPELTWVGWEGRSRSRELDFARNRLKLQANVSNNVLTVILPFGRGKEGWGDENLHDGCSSHL